MTKPFEDLSTSQINKLYELLGVHIYKFSENTKLITNKK